MYEEESSLVPTPPPFFVAPIAFSLSIPTFNPILSCLSTLLFSLRLLQFATWISLDSSPISGSFPMDTTAAAELGFAVVGPGVDGVGFWDNASPDRNRPPVENVDQFANPRKFEGAAWEKGTSRRAFGRHSRPSASGPEAPLKRPRTVQAEMSGEEDGYGERYDGGHGEGSGGIAFAGALYGDSDNGAASRSERMNSGFGGVIAGGGAVSAQGETRRMSNFSGDIGSDARPQTPTSSGASGSPFTVRGRGTGSIFFKTKLCTKFRAGTCPYNSSCNFAHGMEELRKPPPGWEEIVAVQDAERGLRNRETSGQPILSNAASGNSSDFQRLHKTRPCKKYYSEEGCPYGDRCNFLHDDQAGARESNAISLGPSSSPSRGAGGGGGGSGNGNERPPNWKTRMCNKWETTGHCPFGQKCHFAHGLAELQAYGGAHADSDIGTASVGGQRSDAKQGGQASFKTVPDIGSSHASSLYGTDGHNSATISRYGGSVVVSMQIQKQTVKSMPKWKGPADEISTIYGDWIEEDEWERPPLSLKPGNEQSTEKTTQYYQLREQSVQQLTLPLKGNVVVGVSGQGQDSRSNFSKISKNEHGPMQVVYGNVTLYGDGGVDGEEL